IILLVIFNFAMVSSLFCSLQGSVNIRNHIFYCRSGSVSEVLFSEFCIFFLFVCSNDASGGVYDSSQSVFIKEVYQILSLTSLSAISWNQNVSFRHDLSQDLAHFRIGSAYHSAYIAIGISHAFFSPLSNLFSHQFIERSAVNDPVLELTAGRV